MNETLVNWANTVWMSKNKETEKTEWVGTCSIPEFICLYLSLTMWSCLMVWTDTVWHLLFAVEMRTGRKRFFFFFFLKVVDVFALCLVQVTQPTVLWMTSLTTRACHQPSGGVSCTFLSSMYLLSIMLLSWYLCAFFLCPSPSVACCSDSMVLFPLLAPI